MSFNNTIIAFDLGIKNIGVAVGQRITKTANPIKTIKAVNGIPDWKLIGFLFNEWKPEEVIVGLPLNMDGTEQFSSFHARNFSYKIRSLFSVKTQLHDERLSTIEARAKLFEYGGYRALSRYRVNAVSAVVILESYLEKYY